MLVKVFMNSAGHNSEREVLRQMYDGIDYADKTANGKLSKEERKERKNLEKEMGIKRGLQYEYDEEYRPCDVAVFLGSWKPERTRTWHLTRTSIKKNSKCFVVIETPLLGRQMFEKNTHYRVGVNGFLNRDAFWGDNVNRPGDRFNELGLIYKGWKTKEELGDKIIIALQLAGDASLRNLNINEWCVDTVKTLREYTDRPIEIRTHPGVSEKGMGNHEDLFKEFAFANFSNVTFVNGRDIPWEEHLKDAYCVVAYSSGLSIDAVLNGYPVIACDEGNFAWNVAETKLKNIENLNLANNEEVLQWLHNLAYCQWTPEEMENGVCWRHLLPSIEKVLAEVKANESN